MAHAMSLSAIGTFHRRQGDQTLLTGSGQFPAAWGRVFGGSRDQKWTPTINGLALQLGPEIDGQIWGLQAGSDLLGFEHPDGSQDRIGAFFSHTQATGDITGFTLARSGNPSGRLDLQGNSLGAYWTHVGQSGWYLDAVAMQTWLDGDATSYRGIGAELGGIAFAASLEGGYPVALGGGWTLEPQLQGIWQYIDLDATSDRYTSIEYDAFDALTGRIGARLEGNLQVGTASLQPFVDVNLWHNFSATGTIVFNARSVAIESGGTTLEVGGGISAKVTQSLSLYGSASYGTGLDDSDARSISGSVGLRFRW
jgi:outer membrane autotransporter protein